MNEYIIKNGKKLRCGFTTGTCATAAATASAYVLMNKQTLSKVSVTLPSKETIELEVICCKSDSSSATCYIKKDSGDDPDVTDGILIYAEVSFNDTDQIIIDGGIGIGRVTQKGLDCPVGGAAINSIPRQMIIQNVSKVCAEHNYSGGLNILIFAPEGETIAQKTFNPHLGIVGGISIIGTTGIVEPMSEKALIDSLYVEMRVISEKGYKSLLAFPGNYAKSFIDRTLGIRGENSIKYSNYLGEILDYAVEMGFEEILLVGHIGKMVKVAGGMMNTHSHNGDFRMEMLSCYAALNGASKDVISEIMSCVTTEQAIEILTKEKIEKQVMRDISHKAEFYINKRVENKIKTKIIIYSNDCGILN